MNKLLPAALILLLATPLLAQGRSIDVMGFATYVDLSGGDVILGGGDSSSISFDTDQGYGVGINLFLTRRLSAEITIAEIKPDARVSALGAQLDMIPITAVAQYHFNPEGKVDPYVGMGIAYLMFDEFSSRDPDLDLGDVDIRNDYGAVFNAGLSFELGFGFALFGDVKYVPVENKITTRIGEQTIDLNPLIVSAGVVIRF